jgi:hypothetical protein
MVPFGKFMARLAPVARQAFVAGGLLFGLFIGCGAEHPPALDDGYRTRGGSGTTSAGSKARGGDATEPQGGGVSEADAGATAEPQGGQTTEGKASAGGSTEGGATGGSVSKPAVIGFAKFDPAQVYLVSRLVNSPYLVLSPTSDVKQYAIGISDLSTTCSMKLWGDQLVYQADGRPLLRFSLDVAGSPRRDTLRIPGDALDDNDVAVATPGCAGASVEDFYFDPQGGLVYSCAGKPYVWYLGADQVADDVSRIRALGNNGLAILDLKDASGPRVRTLAGGDDYLVAELDNLDDPLTEVAFRAHYDGFHVAAVRSGNGRDAAAELWEISSEGVVSVLGTYPALPNLNFSYARYALDANDILYAYAFVSQVRYQLVRLTLTGDVTPTDAPEDSDLLFEKRTTEPALVTGP